MEQIERKTILTFIGYYLPGYKAGGALRTIANMVDVLGNDLDFKLVTRDRDWGDDSPYKNIKVNEWNDSKNCKIFYQSNNSSPFTHNRLLVTLINNTEFDIYYLNSLFDFSYSVKIILLRKLRLIPQKKVILAPRGELMEGALSLKSFKKKLFLLIANVLNIYSDVIWHSSSEAEAKEIKREMGANIETRIALDIPDYSLLDKNFESIHKKEKDKLKILFISCIVPKKNLKFAIEVLNKIEGDFTFCIYGPIKDEKYWKQCLDAISPKIKARVNYRGEISNSEINNVYPNYDLFFFPTLGENFGHVIWESLVFGCLVLTTDTTPWNGLEEFGVGWNYNLNDTASFISIINGLFGLDSKTYNMFSNSCKEYLSNFSNRSTYEVDNIELFN